MTAPTADPVPEAAAGPTEAEQAEAELKAKLDDLRLRIDTLQEDADRLGMYMHLGDKWAKAHLNAVTQLAEARTKQAVIAARHEDAARAVEYERTAARCQS
ncbi:hypothetical protein [Nocardia wallacei]|uniref:hypothetical protein n=1 Tax=Nocardia wallacei TaxID=480035 RepID=UPI002458BB45|nr:hypothetical protein [Nocardia wallacei]